MFIVWHFQYLAYKYILNLYEINHTLLFFMLLPIEFGLIMLLSIIVEMVDNSVKNKIKMIKRREKRECR